MIHANRYTTKAEIRKKKIKKMLGKRRFVRRQNLSKNTSLTQHKNTTQYLSIKILKNDKHVFLRYSHVNKQISYCYYCRKLLANVRSKCIF